LKIVAVVLQFAQSINVCRAASAGRLLPQAKFDFDREAASKSKLPGVAAAQTFAPTGVEYYILPTGSSNELC